MLALNLAHTALLIPKYVERIRLDNARHSFFFLPNDADSWIVGVNRILCVTLLALLDVSNVSRSST
jgi:hypothetical protein